MTRFERMFVWLGGAMFAASLAATAYCYLVRWAMPAAAFAPRSIAIDAALFAVFAAHHSLLARDVIKRRVERFVPRRLLRAVYVWTASLLLLIVLAFWVSIGGDVYRASGIAGVLFTALQLAGLVLIARSVATIDPLELAGIRANPRREGLQIGGPYRIVRHPLYLGWVLAVFGAAHMTGDRLAFAVLTTIYLVVAIPWEERSLRAAFGTDYERYQQSVRWRILPYVY